MRITRIGGVLLVIFGLVVNVWSLETFVVPDGHVESIARLGIAVVQLALISAGVWLFIKGPRLKIPSASQCVVFIVSTLFSLGIAEIALRILQFDKVTNELAYVGQFENRPSNNFEVDTNTGWRMRKNHEVQWTIGDNLDTYKANALGFRSHRDFDHSPKVLIAITGDSFAWGAGVDYDETFGHLLESHDAGSEVFNFAMPGFGLDQMWMSVRHQILPLKPSVIIVAFIDDDLERSLTAYRKVEGFNKPRFVVDSVGSLRPQTSADVPNSFLMSLQSNSRLWNVVSRPLSRMRPLSEWWILNTAIFEAIASDCGRQGVPVLFIRLPEESSKRFPSLDRFMQSKGFAFLNLGTPDIPEGLHFKNDGHINVRGHQFVARKITKWMQNEEQNGEWGKTDCIETLRSSC
jgi:hypothetical protein